MPKKFGPAGDCRHLKAGTLKVKKNAMVRTCSTHSAEERRMEGFCGEHEGKRQFGTHAHRWENSTKNESRKNPLEGVDWINMAQDRNKGRVC
jgi:hypothetical protein